MANGRPAFDPLAILAALERQATTYVVVGALARVIQGSDELTHGVDIAPSLREKNLERVEAALQALEARPRDHTATALADRIERGEELIPFTTNRGELKIVPMPAGTRGYDDLRRRARREYLGHRVRVEVASIDDLARMVAAREREEDLDLLLDMRRLAELERTLGPSLDLGL